MKGYGFYRKEGAKVFSLFAVFAYMFTASFLTLSVCALADTNKKYAGIVIDVSTGTVLYQDRANYRRYPASLTKMMTLLMTFDALRSGEITLKTEIPISNYAASMVPSKLGLKPGSTIRVEDAILSLVTKSANDVAVALAEKLGKSEKAFGRMMTKRARELGMRRTVFRNASGLHDPAQVTTANDMALLSRVLIMQYPEYYHYFSKRSFTYKGATYKNHNKLLGSYDGMDGLKTGYIQASGFNLAASAEQDGRRLIGVVFGGKTGKSRNADMVRILDNGFIKAKSLGLLVASTIPIPEEKPIYVASSGEIYAKPKHIIVNDSLPRTASHHKIDEHDDEMDISVKERVSRWVMLDPDASESLFRRMIGEGDYDDAVRSRIATGLIAISAITGDKVPSGEISLPRVSNKYVTKSKPEYVEVDRNWGIQVGAYTTRDSANKAIAMSVQRLPASLRQVTAAIAPRKIDGSWVFRGRLSGYSKEDAHKACGMLKECLIVPPQIYSKNN